MTTQTSEVLADMSDKGGRPRLGRAANGGPSPQQSIRFGPAQSGRLKTMAAELTISTGKRVSRNRLVIRALTELVEQHGDADQAPIAAIEGVGNQLQYIPAGDVQESALARLRHHWGLATVDDVRRIAIELMLVSNGHPAPASAPVAEPSTEG